MITRLDLNQIRQNFHRSGTDKGYFIAAANNQQPNFAEPYRTQTYGVGLFHKGRIGLSANLQDYEVTAPGLILMGPEVIREWRTAAEPIFSTTFFFTPAFLLKGFANSSFLDQFPFFAPDAKHFLPLSAAAYDELQPRFEALSRTEQNPGRYKEDVLRHSIITILFLIQERYTGEETAANQPGEKPLVRAFKHLLTQHFLAERSVQFYAEQLFVTPKHLSQLLKQETGQTAGDWINQMVILEAKLLLQQEGQTVSEVAYQLNFSDSSFFGKFFKRHTGKSPGQYRKAL